MVNIAKKFIFIILLLILGLGLFGCVKQSEEINQNEVDTNDNLIVNIENGEEIDTSDWKTYKNEEYGFEFQYPEDYLIQAIKDGVYIKHISYDLVPNVPAKGGAISIAISNITIEDRVKEIENLDPPLSRVVDQKEYILDNTRGIEIISSFPSGIDHYDIFIGHNDKELLISYEGIGLSYVKKILHTFRFIK